MSDTHSHKTILRKAKKNNFTIINNDILRNKNLSWKAKGLLCYLLSLPDDWEINLKHLENQAKDGSESLRSGLKELEEEGYLLHKSNRNESGQFSGHEWIVYEDPFEDVDKKIPKSENPKLVTQNSANPILLSTKDNQELKNKEKSPKPKKVSLPSAIASEISFFFFEEIKKNNPDHKPPNFDKWAVEIDRLIKIDKRHSNEIKALIIWSQENSFWKGNILSPESLRKNFDRLRIQLNEKKQEKPKALNNPESIAQYFQNNEVYNGATCYINESGISFERGITHRNLSFKTPNFKEQLNVILTSFQIDII